MKLKVFCSFQNKWNTLRSRSRSNGESGEARTSLYRWKSYGVPPKSSYKFEEEEWGKERWEEEEEENPSCSSILPPPLLRRARGVKVLFPSCLPKLTLFPSCLAKFQRTHLLVTRLPSCYCMAWNRSEREMHRSHANIAGLFVSCFFKDSTGAYISTMHIVLCLVRKFLGTNAATARGKVHESL